MSSPITVSSYPNNVLSCRASETYNRIFRNGTAFRDLLVAAMRENGRGEEEERGQHSSTPEMEWIWYRHRGRIYSRKITRKEVVKGGELEGGKRGIEDDDALDYGDGKGPMGLGGCSDHNERRRQSGYT